MKTALMAPIGTPIWFRRIVAPLPTSNSSFSGPASTSVAAEKRLESGNGEPVPRRVTLKSCAFADMAASADRSAPTRQIFLSIARRIPDLLRDRRQLNSTEPPRQPVVERVLGAEHIIELTDGDVLGAAADQPVGEIGHAFLGAGEHDETGAAATP